MALAPCRIALRIIWHGARLLNALPTSKMRMTRWALRLAMSPSLEEHGGELEQARRLSDEGAAEAVPLVLEHVEQELQGEDCEEEEI